MTILFDHQTFSIQSYGGISRYFAQLCLGINATAGNQTVLGVRWSDNVYLNTPPPFSKRQFIGRGRLLYAINQQYSHTLIRQGRFDLLHTTYYDPAFLGTLGNRPFVMTIHDMIHERLHAQFQELRPDRFVEGKRRLAEKASAIIAVSEYTRQDIIALLNVDPARVHVVHHASSLPAQSSKALPQPDRSYLLFVGNRGQYKNFDSLLQALALLIDLSPLRLVCAGGGVFSAEEQSRVAALGLVGRVEQRPFQTDEELLMLYKGAVAFVFPSLYEGFGIPILEAFAGGCPCILSRSSSLPEVAEDAALYIEPTSSDDIAQTIRLLIADVALQRSLVHKGYQRLRAFTWQQTVNQTLTVYQSVLDAYR